MLYLKETECSILRIGEYAMFVKLMMSAGLGAFLSIASAASPQDGYIWRVSDHGNNYGNAGNQNYYNALIGAVPVRNGGVLRMAPGLNNSAFLPTRGSAMNVHSQDRFGGIDFTNTCWVLWYWSSSIKMNMVGARPFINSDEPVYGGRIGLRLQIYGEATNTLVKTGGGNLTLDQLPIANFASVEVSDGMLATTSTLASVITECPVVLNGGGLSYKPSLADGGAASAALASGGITASGLFGSLAAARGENDSLTLNVGTLVLEDGALFSIDHSGSLGTGEKVLSSGRAEGDEAGSLVVRDTSSPGMPFAFASYSADGGFAPKTGSGDVSASGSIMLVNTAAADGFTSGDAVDFGTSRGIIWKSSPAVTVEMKTPVAGSAGVIFAGRYDEAAPSSLAFSDGTYCSWSGGTVFAGVRAVMRGVKPFPDDKPVEIVGLKRYGSSSLFFESDLKPENDFLLSGSGYKGEGAAYAAAGADVEFAGRVTLRGSAVFGGEEESCFSFANPVSGDGDFELRSGAAVFENANAYGKTLVTGGMLTLTGSGAFGAGDVRHVAGDIVFDGAEAEIGNTILSTGGTVRLVDNSTVGLLGAGTVLANLAVESGSALEISGHVTVKGLELPEGAAIKGVDGTLEINCTDDLEITGTLAAGATGGLTLCKSGSGTLTIPCDAVLSELIVKEGAVRFSAGEESHVVSVGTLRPVAGGRIDLNGCSLSAGTLSGAGVIGNDSTDGGVVAVTGETSFKGVLNGNATLQAAGDMEIATLSGADISLQSGITRLAVFDYAIPASGLLYHLDASETDAIVADDNGFVTNWTAVAGTVSCFYWDAAITNDKWRAQSGPVLKEDGINGKPALWFNGPQGLRSAEKCTAKTVIMVARYGGWYCNSQGLWGMYETDSGVRYDGVKKLQCYGYFPFGSTFHFNGKDLSRTVARYWSDDLSPSVVSFAFDEKKTDGGDKNYNCLNLYNINRGGKHYIGEVMAYDRTLSNEELLEIENYLSAKWLTGIPLIKDASAATVGSVAVSAGADGKVTPAEVTGTVKLAPSATLTVKGTPSKTSQTVLTVDGDVTGDFASSDRLAGLYLTRAGNIWRYKYDGMTIIIK